MRALGLGSRFPALRSHLSNLRRRGSCDMEKVRCFKGGHMLH